jgi:hypothetical protein
LNPQDGQTEAELDAEESPEDEWLNSREKKVIVTTSPDVGKK